MVVDCKLVWIPASLGVILGPPANRKQLMRAKTPSKAAHNPCTLPCFPSSGNTQPTADRLVQPGRVQHGPIPHEAAPNSFQPSRHAAPPRHQCSTADRTSSRDVVGSARRRVLMSTMGLMGLGFSQKAVSELKSLGLLAVATV